MNRSDTRFAGYDCIKLENQALQLWVTHNAGPRIIGLQLHGRSNLLAVVPDMSVTTPAGQVYHFRGGHRLWYAPEDVERTYLPDDTAVTVTNFSNGIQVTQAVEARTGIEKQMTITLPDDSASVIIVHTLTNRGTEAAVELAPWALTQFKTGGFAILPQPTHDTGLLPNRRLVLWPYTRINSPHLRLGDRFIFVQAAMKNERFKLGWANREGWLGYWIDDTLFVKEAAHQEDGRYYDSGSSGECYCDDHFLELETLGPRTTLAPGQSVTHRETWRIFPNITLTPEESAVLDKLPF